MKRRLFLTGAMSALIGVVGCLSQSDSILSQGSSPVSSVEFDVYQPDDQEYSDMPSVTEPPKIDFNSNQNMVVISGTLFVGSSDCNIASITGRNYDKGSDKFTVTVGSGTKDSGNSCSGDESADAYRIRAEFESTLPETVTATEEDGDNRSTTVHP